MNWKFPWNVIYAIRLHSLSFSNLRVFVWKFVSRIFVQDKTSVKKKDFFQPPTWGKCPKKDSQNTINMHLNKIPLSFILSGNPVH